VRFWQIKTTLPESLGEENTDLTDFQPSTFSTINLAIDALISLCSKKIEQSLLATLL
jgi:hypothetical protein